MTPLRKLGCAIIISSGYRDYDSDKLYVSFIQQRTYTDFFFYTDFFKKKVYALYIPKKDLQDTLSND